MNRCFEQVHCRGVIYLDHHASTPLTPAVRAAMIDWLQSACGNPSSVHYAGRVARARIEQARATLAEHVGARPRELVFTSGGTEAVHLVVQGVGEGLGVRAVFVDPGAHPSLRAASQALASAHGIPLELVPSFPGGAPDLERLAARMTAVARPALVALSLVQHETGAIAPLRRVVEVVRPLGAVVVVDAVQALGKIPVDLGASGAVAAALSAHKIGGPAGVGAAWISAEVSVSPRMTGGAQERGLRAGTENVLGIVGFEAAVRELPQRLSAMPAIAARRDRIEHALLGLGDVVINGQERERVATACHASLRGVVGEELVAALDLEGICVSSGPACSSGRPGPSMSMQALYPDEPWRAMSSLRITLGPEVNDADVDGLIAVLPDVVARVRDRSE